tara:strand:+ start:1912 stop:2160 length:249 start_codon:yes stop_codon:yes gene_type:complete
MVLYPQISDESLLLHENSKILLRRKSKKDIITEVMKKINPDNNLNNIENNSNNIENNSNNIENTSDKFCFLILLLNFLGCNK